MKQIEQAVIPCGGQGARLASLTDLPKILAPIGGRPLLSYLLDDLSAGGVRRVLLLAGYLGREVERAARSMATAGMEITTLVEEQPLGTAGSLRMASEHLDEVFFLVFGDIFTSLDWRKLGTSAISNGGLATLLVHRSAHPNDSDRVILSENDRISGWPGRNRIESTDVRASRQGLTNSAVGVLNRSIVDIIRDHGAADLFGEVFPHLVSTGAEVFGYRSSEYVKDIGTPKRFEAVSQDVVAGTTGLRAQLALIDRDGVLCEDVDLLHHPDQLRLIPGAAEGLDIMNQAGIKVVVVTNQPVVARGLCSFDDLRAIHDKLSAMLTAKGGGRWDGLYFCPHHPENHHGEGVSSLRIRCGCRKPGTGMVEKALAEYEVPPWRTIVVGDRSTDMQLALNAGLPSIGLDSGLGCHDGRFPARPVMRFEDLRAAARWMAGV